jgi:hypothetical protein
MSPSSRREGSRHMTPGETASSSSKPRRRSAERAAALFLALLMTLALCAPGAGAASTKRILSVLNSQRAANGIPAGIAENPAWSAACKAHNAYERRNHAFGHGEIEGKPGFSAQGNLIAATSVLAQGISWDHGDPYDDAPYHLFDLLNPRISSIGAADSEGFGCVEIELGTLRPAPSQVTAFSYPGNHRRGVPVSERASEQPMTPGQTLGLGVKATGPNLLVYFDGPWTNGSRVQISSATMTSPRGSVTLRWLDNTTSDLLAPTGAILVPVKPLRAATAYRVHVEASVAGVVPGTTVEEAIPGGGCQEGAGGAVSCGQPTPTACVEDFATQQAVCGLSRTWAARDDFSFTTAGRRAGH